MHTPAFRSDWHYNMFLLLCFIIGGITAAIALLTK
jgi:hypothetical protein